MISAELTKQIVKALADHLGVVIARGNQRFSKPPAVPYGTYNVIAAQEESAHQNVIIPIDDVDLGNGLMGVEIWNKTRATLSLAFLDQDRVDRIGDLCNRALSWFKYSSSGVDFCNSLGVVPRLISPQIQDRSVYLEAGYENKYGFDIFLDSSPVTSGVTNEIFSIQITSDHPEVDFEIDTGA